MIDTPRFFRPLLVLSLALTVFPRPVAAGAPPVPEKWTFSVGAGTLYKPAFAGSKDYQTSVFPSFKVEYGDRFFASPFEGVGYKVINNDRWNAGPLMKLDFGRDEDDDSPFRIAGDRTKALRGLGDVDRAIELGGFAEYNWKTLSGSLELRQATDGHDGFIGEAGINARHVIPRRGKPIILIAGPRTTFADSNFNDAYFGITPAQSTRSGLPPYNPGAGFISHGAVALVIVSLTRATSLSVMANVERLSGEAADSPLVRERGDRDQFMGMIRIGHKL